MASLGEEQSSSASQGAGSASALGSRDHLFATNTGSDLMPISPAPPDSENNGSTGSDTPGMDTAAERTLPKENDTMVDGNQDSENQEMDPNADEISADKITTTSQTIVVSGTSHSEEASQNDVNGSTSQQPEQSSQDSSQIPQAGSRLHDGPNRHHLVPQKSQRSTVTSPTRTSSLPSVDRRMDPVASAFLDDPISAICNVMSWGDLHLLMSIAVLCLGYYVPCAGPFCLGFLGFSMISYVIYAILCIICALLHLVI